MFPNQTINAVAVSTLLGVVWELFVLSLVFFMEHCPHSRISSNVFLASLNGVISVLVGRLVAPYQGSTHKLLVSLAAVFVMVPVSAVCFKPPELDESGKPGESNVHPLLPPSGRCVSAPYGTIAGSFIGAMPFQNLERFFGQYPGLAISVGVGLVIGILYALTCDVLVSRRPGRWAVSTGTVAALVCGLLVHWLIGVVAGSIVGTIVGSIFEMLEIRQMKAQVMEQARYTKPTVVSEASFQHSSK